MRLNCVRSDISLSGPRDVDEIIAEVRCVVLVRDPLSVDNYADPAVLRRHAQRGYRMKSISLSNGVPHLLRSLKLGQVSQLPDNNRPYNFCHLRSREPWNRE